MKKESKWTILKKTRKTKKHGYMVLCRCSCGLEKEVLLHNIKAKKSRRCSSCATTEAEIGKTHGKTGTKEYIAWKNLIGRCTNKHNPKYKSYGGRGISVCSRWRHSFQFFFNDMGYAPSEHHSIDRINNDGNYEPNNCEWSTSKEQNNNKRSNRVISFYGVTLTVSQWGEVMEIPSQRIINRLRSNWSDFDAIFKPKAS